MAVPAERMKAIRERRRARGLRELNLVIPDARATAVRQRVADQVARLQQASEDDALRWIEAVAATDDPGDKGGRFRDEVQHRDGSGIRLM